MSGSEFGMLLWHHLIAQKKWQYGCTTSHCGAQQLQRYFEKFTSSITFGAHNLVRSEPFLDYLYELWQLLSALCSYVRKKNLYRYTSTFLALNHCSKFPSNLSAIYTKWGAQKFQLIFGLYAIFDCNFAKIVVPPSGKNKKSIALLNGQSLPKNGENCTEIDP